MKRILAVLMLSVVGVSCIYAAPKDRNSGIIWSATPMMGVDLADKNTSNYVWRNVSVNSDYETIVFTSTNSVVKQGGYWIVDSSSIVQEIKNSTHVAQSNTYLINIDTNTSATNAYIQTVSTLSALSAANLRELIGETTNNFRQNQFANVSGSSITIGGNSSVYVATAVPVVQSGYWGTDSTSTVQAIKDLLAEATSQFKAGQLIGNTSFQAYTVNDSSNTPSNEVGTIVTGSGIFVGVTINTAGVGSTVKVYDNTTNSGKTFCNIDTTSKGTTFYNVGAYIGITYESAGATPADITILYK
jgi:hypothetical protein